MIQGQRWRRGILQRIHRVDRRAARALNETEYEYLVRVTHINDVAALQGRELPPSVGRYDGPTEVGIFLKLAILCLLMREPLRNVLWTELLPCIELGYSV